MATATVPETDTGLHVKLLRAQAKMPWVGKRGVNTGQNYTYTRGEDVVREANKVFTELGLTVKPQVCDVWRDGKHTLVALQYDVRDVDSGEIESYTWYAEGMDGGDKAIGKALTAGYKYFLLNLLLQVPADEDPEADPSTDNSAPSQRIGQSEVAKIQQVLHAWGVTDNDVQLALTALGCSSLNELTESTATQLLNRLAPKTVSA